ncbi:mercuric reductase [bacterium BMS3Abin14]|nr:mercuric reductase [bacterium BMS3Abin14]
MEHYDAIIIGSGQSGNPLAVKLAVSGWNVALVEKEHIGGSCVNVGCSPTKTMVASARAAYVAGRAADYGVSIDGSVGMDMRRVRERKRAIVDSFSGGDQAKLERKGVRIIWGEAGFTGPREIEVALNDGGTERISGDKIFIDTGTRPAIPEIDGLDRCAIHDNATIMELSSVPEHLLVIGGGYIGVEFAGMFRRFGAKVTIVHNCEYLLCREDQDVGEAIQDIFREDGIEIMLNARTSSATQDADGTVHLAVTTPDGEKTITGSHLLISAGRIPNTDMLNLETAGLKVDDRGFIPTNDRLETAVPGIYAMGDVKGGPAFTHISYDDYRVIRDNLFGGGGASITDRMVPYVVFMDPQLGRIGLSEVAAAEAGVEFNVVKMPMAYVARAIEMDETRGFMKALVDPDSGKILGFSCLGMEGGELMAVVQVAMMGGLTYRDLREGIFAHPTLAESLNNLFSLVDQ